MTRDTASNPGGGGTRGPRRPADRRHPDAATAGDESWSSGLTGPQRAFPAWDGVPGYEFEGRRASRRPPPPEAPPPEAPAPEAPAPEAGPRRFRYTPTIGQPMPAPLAWDDQPARDGQRAPGFEFDATAQIGRAHV